MKRIPAHRLLAVGTLLAGGASASAAFTAFDPTGRVFTNGQGNDGLYFTPTVPITVSTLGYYNCGFSESHQVALFDVTTQTMLIETTITGTSALSNGFRYESIAPLNLNAGQEYAVVGLNGYTTNTDTAVLANAVNNDPAITFNGYFYNYDQTLTFPTIAYATPILGPNFQFTDTVSSANASVPEPGDAATGACSVALLGRRRRS
jgi:hypothetical protein